MPARQHVPAACAQQCLHALASSGGAKGPVHAPVQAGRLEVAAAVLAPQGGRAVGGLALMPLLHDAISSPAVPPFDPGGCWPAGHPGV